MAARMTSQGERFVGLLDIGSSKTICAVVDRGAGDGAGQVVGVGQQRSRGVASGSIIDLPAAEASIASAVARAERAADVRLDTVIVNVSCGRLESHRFRAHVALDGAPVGQSHITQLHAGAAEYAERHGRRLIHWNRTEYRLDAQRHVVNPLGLAGDTLTGCYHAVNADAGAVRNLIEVIERAYLAARLTVPSPLASAYAVTTEDERNLGVLVADFGGGTITFAGFKGGTPFACGAIPFGGHHVTYDIMQHFEIDELEAERIKTLYGSMARAPSDETAILPLAAPAGGGFREGPPTRADLFTVIDHRVRRHLAVLGERLVPLRRHAGLHAPLVVTGGASQFPAMIPAIADMLGIDTVKPGRPRLLAGLPETYCGPQYATLSGLARFATAAAMPTSAQQPTRRYVDRLQRWVLETF
jgi:cell division protein FtsA